MRRSRFKKHLGLLNEDELRLELETLYNKLDSVKQYYTMELGSPEDRKVLFDRAKKQITSKYATKSYRKPRRPRIQKINAILNDMSKKSVFTHEIIDLLLFDVETALQFMRKYDFFSEVLANHIEKVFERAIMMIADLNVMKDWRTRCQNIVSSSRHHPGIHVDLEHLMDQATG